MTQAPSDVQHRAGSLLDKYQVPPFSVLDTRQGYWQEARRAWLALGIRSELGRGFTEGDGKVGAIPMTGMAGKANIAMRTSAADRADMRSAAFKVGDEGYFASRGSTNKPIPVTETTWEVLERTSRMEADLASNVTGAPALPDYAADFAMAAVAPGTSIFDPVLCELAYRWWCPPDGVILDPFAGGSVRGIVAGWLGHAYTGVDLSAAQLDSNREQAAAIMGDRPLPTWIHGDSRQVIPTLGEEWADFVFTCPPYYDLEVYSDDPADLSAMTDWPAFLSAYGDIIGHSLTALKRDRFAAIVVSEIRGKDGIFRGLVPWTIRQFEMHGARYYNEAVLINPAGTLPMRIGKQFDAGRKLGRSHQNVLVFVKGNVPKTHEWGYERTSAPSPQLEMFEDAPQGADGRPL
jgi:hypothetical protein